MTSMQFVIQPLPGTDEQFIERLREVSDKVNKFGFGTHRIFEQLKIPVKSVVVGPNHIGVLLEDGKVFRVAFSINSERLDLTKSDAAKTAANTASNAASTSKNAAPSSSSSRQLARSRARLMRTTGRSGSGGQGSSGSRSTGVIIGGSSSSRPLVTVPTTYVPEELISQAEVVLQGKSRNLIIRELQRTNLDVNLAVNNLLSRDDEEADDTEEGGDNYVPEDLISLLDNGFHGDNNSVIIDPADGLFSEEIFSNYSSIRNLLFDRIRSERNQSNPANSGDNSQPRSSASAVGGGALGGGGASTLSAQISSANADREAFSRWRDRQYYGPRRWLNKDDYVWDKDADTKKKEPSSLGSPIWISEELQPWTDKNNSIRFKQIGALYSEFIAISETGELHQWKWSDPEPYKSEAEHVYHPKTLVLNICEKVEFLSANFIRCSVVSEGNRVATWMDEQLGYLGAKLEHPSIAFSEFAMDSIVSIHVCSLYTAVRTENNNVYWWGVLPFDQRRYLWDKFRNKTKKPFKNSVTSEIGVGTQVVMKKCPTYQTGSIGFTCANGVPKVGQLLNSVWDFNDVCRFKIMNVSSALPSEKPAPVEKVEKDVTKAPVLPVAVGSSSSGIQASSSGSGSKTNAANSNKETTDRIDMPPPPSPASSTCSDTGSVTSHKRTKRVAAKDESGSESRTKDEELWQLKDVVFVEDKIGPIGKVLKVDGEYVAVRFPVTNGPLPPVSTSGSSCSSSGVVVEGKEDDWQQCRLLRREDVQVYKTAMTSRGPDWLQKLPKKINITHGADPATFQLLALSVDTRGIHVVKRVASKLHYSLYNLYNSKQEQNCQFPTDSGSFMGSSAANITMNCNNDCSGSTSTVLLCDGNRALYPVAKDCLGSIKDPQWFDLPPVKAVAMTTISLPASGGNQKARVCMTALLFDALKLMPHILRCDLKNAFATLGSLEREERGDLLSVVDERCDGGRNIFHACTVMCAPTSNKDNDEPKKITLNTVAPASSSGARAAPSSSGSGSAVFAISVPGGGSSAAASSGGLDASTSAAASSASAPPTFSSVSASMAAAAAASSGAVREGRTVSLREMMNRLINTDQAEQSTSSASNGPAAAANNADDLYMQPWSMAAESASNTSASAQSNASSSSTTASAGSGLNDVAMECSDTEIAKLIVAAATSATTATVSKLSAPNYVFEPVQRREQATLILQQMCASAALRPHLPQLLSARDAQGQTPFMLAVHSRAYEAGIVLLTTILALADKDTALKEAMIFPTGAPPDQSPLHVICYNDTCSFTWTGADHINQNIYECKTCGLTGSLCCCTECARVCHKGHDCKVKHTSPTAYCDCWEKCKCRALIAGNQNKRFALLCKLAACTDLVSRFNAKGESILLFLIQTVGRQTIEQRQYRANNRVRNVSGSGAGNAGASSSSGAASRKSSAMDVDSDMPEHDLEPPKFARRALERLLIDWNAVRAMIMTGAERGENVPQQAPNSTEGASAESYNIYLQTQHSSTLLDKFTHSLFVKCSAEHLDTLLLTMVRELQNELIEGRAAEAEAVARRFVRSVARVFVIFNMEKLPNPERRKHLAPNKHIQSCVKVFQTLHKISIQELCEVSEALITPVRLGVVRPTAPFAMSPSSIDTTDDLFSVEPLAPSSVVEAAVEPAASLDGNPHEPAAAFNLQTTYAIEEALREASESEEVPSREGNAHSHNHGQDEDILEGGRNDEGLQDDESDNEFTFNDAETESDSDDNQSNQDAQRSVQTGATVGSETDIGVLFLEDESGDSSAQDEEASEDGETDDHSDEFNFADHQLERRNVNASLRADLAPQSMQWAIRSRDTARSSVRVTAGSSMVLIDPMALRRSTVPSSSAVAAPPQEHHTMATTASNLARAFGIIVRQISELLSTICHNLGNDVDTPLKIDHNEVLQLQTFVETRLKPTWDWMFSVMDGTEAQLKFGAYLTNYTDPTHPLHPLNLSAQSSNQSQSSNNNSASSSGVGVNMMGASSRRDFFTYCLSLMRSHTSEHRDALPVLDITALRHIGYVLDGFIYYMRNDSNFYERSDTCAPGCAIGALNATPNDDDTDEELSNITNDDSYGDTNCTPSTSAAAAAAAAAATSNLQGGTATARRHSFFTRSDSTLSLGCLAPDGFDLPLDVSMPLADKPHLLQPNSKREDLFANLPLIISNVGDAGSRGANTPSASVLDLPPTRLGFSSYSCPASNVATLQSEHGDENEELSKCHSETHHMQTDTESSSSDPDAPEPMDTTDDAAEDGPDDESDKSSQTTKVLAMITRPEVIIAPTKAQQRANDAADALAASGSGSGSIVRSVIVRAGTSTAVFASKAKTDETDVGIDQRSMSRGVDFDTKSGNVDIGPSGSSSSVRAFRQMHVKFMARGYNFCRNFTCDSPSWNFLLGRWKLTLDLFGRVFMDDVGMEHGSVLPELRGFPVKEMRFRRHMEKLRNAQQRDLVLCKLERSRDNLIVQTFKELNTTFGSQNRRVHPPLTFNRVKVTFKDEPGEGSGVARSFYTSISEALLSGAKMPNLESVQMGNNSKYGVPFSSILRNRGAAARDHPTLQRRGTGSKILWRTARERKVLNYDARAYTPTVSNNADNSADNPNEHLSSHLQQLGDRLYPKIFSINATNAPKITGMLLEIPTPQLLSILSSEETLRQKVTEALDIIMFKQNAETASSSAVAVQAKKMIPVVLLEQCHVEDNEPLFYSPGKRGFYTPRQGYGSFERINAFRNIGRLIGLCLLQNELLPLFLQRHVLKYILGRKIKFHDLAFFDAAIYESFRQLIQNAQTEEGEETISRMELFFVIDLMKEEGGGSIELIPGGREVQVTSSNLYEYIRRYTEYRLIKSQEKALEALKDGVFDVLPDSCMNSLTSEDLRLLLNGVGDINVSTLISYTTFNDESSEGSDKLLKFKRWFWSIVEKMNTLERQDLVYFWTGSPALPASEEGFQPLPSVTIRPADDSHLPTANTCISRLYIPLYSSKSILRNKMLLAIKSKNFGFV